MSKISKMQPPALTTKGETYIFHDHLLKYCFFVSPTM